MFIKSMNNLSGSGWLVFFVLVPLLLIGACKKNTNTSSTNNALASTPPVSAEKQAGGDLASEINKVLKIELEKEFGPLKDKIEYDKKEMWGRVIAIVYELPKDNRLDDTWGEKVVEALDRLGITATYEGNEVRGEKQKIAGQEASSIQLTTQRTIEDPDVIAFTAMFLQNR